MSVDTFEAWHQRERIAEISQSEAEKQELRQKLGETYEQWLERFLTMRAEKGGTEWGSS